MTHTFPLTGGWVVWRSVVLRGAGFPAKLVQRAGSGLEALLGEVHAMDTRVADARAALIDAYRAAPPDAAKAAQHALKLLWKRRVPEADIGVPVIDASRAAYASAATRSAQLLGSWDEAYETARRATADYLRSLCRDDRFRQAMLWQNPGAVTGGLDWLGRQAPATNDYKTRENERLVASYLQRYCVKNDTIGFFGPVGWATFVPTMVPITQRPGASLLAKRTVFFEYWAMDALARKLAADPLIRLHLPPRLLPRFRIEGTTIYLPVDRASELPADIAAVGRLCDGTRTPSEIGEALGIETSDVVESVEALVDASVAVWTLSIPTHVPHPDQALAALLARLPAGTARARAEDVLAGLIGHRDEVAASATASELQLALSSLGTAFTRETDEADHRARGQAYAGRTPVYEDCLRDTDVEIGAPILAKLAHPLGLVLASARWFTHEIAARFRVAFDERFDRLAHHRAVSFEAFSQDLRALFAGVNAKDSIVASVRGELQRRWHEILGLEDPGDRVQRSASQIADNVARAFAAPYPGWPRARHHSPDIMLCARGPEAISRGEVTAVLGEIHVGFNTVVSPLFLLQSDHREELLRQWEADLPPVIAPVWSKAKSRADFYSLSDRDLDLEGASEPSARPRDHVVAWSELEIERRDGALHVVTRDGRRRWDIIEFFDQHLVAETFAAFSLFSTAARTPRITIDELVIARATWRFTPPDWTWAELKDPAQRFLAAVRWAHGWAIPRYAFVKTAEETKPVFVDFHSTIFVEILAKLLRGASAASISEMLPNIDETWLVDGDGATYTSELRIAAVDPEPWRAPGA